MRHHRSTAWAIAVVFLAAVTASAQPAAEADKKAGGEDSEAASIEAGTVYVERTHSRLTANPADDSGYQQIDEGDHVSIMGTMDEGFFKQQVLDADLVTSVVNESS